LINLLKIAKSEEKLPDLQCKIKVEKSQIITATVVKSISIMIDDYYLFHI